MLSRMRREAWLWALCVAQAGTVLVFLNFAGALPLVKADWQLSNTQAGAIQAAGQVGYVLSVLVVSSLADYVSPERLVLGGALIAGAASLAFATTATGPVSAVVLRALIGLGVAGVYMPGVNLISRRTPSSGRGRAVGIFVAGFSFGAAVSIALGGTLSARFGWRTAFALTSIGPLVGALFAWRGLFPAGSRTVRAPQAARTTTVDLVRNRPALLAIAAYTAHVWELFGIRSWLPAFFAAALVASGSNLARATSSGATVAGIATMIGAAATAATASLSDRFGRTRTVALVMLASIAFTVAAGFTLGRAWALVAAIGVLAAAIANADSASLSTTLTETVEPHLLGRALAVFSFAGFAAGTVSPLAVGVVLDLAGAHPWRWAFGVLALGSLVGLLVIWPLHRRLSGTARHTCITCSSHG